LTLIISLVIYYFGLSHFLRKDHNVLKLMVLYQFLNVLIEVLYKVLLLVQTLYVADLKALGKTNALDLCKYADDTTLLVPQHCDVQFADELEHVIKWSKANKLK